MTTKTFQDHYEDSRRLLKQAQDLFSEYEGKEMPGDKAAEFDRLMEASDSAKTTADRLKGILDRDAALGKLGVSGGDVGAQFDGFEPFEERLSVPQQMQAARLATPDATLGQPAGDMAAVKQIAAILYPEATYKAGYQELRWKHQTAFGKWARFGTSALDPIERRLGYGGKVLLTPMQIVTALRNGIGPAQLKDLVEGVDTAGGFLVPEDFRATVVRGMADAVVMRPRARVVATSRDVLRAPKLTGDGNSYSSAVRLTWGAETPTAGSHETDPTFGQVAIPVHTAMASTQLSLDLMEDSAFDVPGLLAELYTEAYALGEDDAFLTGDGANKPIGLNNTAINGISTVNTGNATSVTADGLLNQQYGLPTQYWPRALWIMNATSAGKAIRQLKDGEGNYLWQRGLAGEPDTLLGKEIAYSSFMPNLAASSKSLIYGDPNYYWIADRVGMTMQRLQEVYAERNMVGFVARKRVGGAPVVTNAFRVSNTSV